MNLAPEAYSEIFDLRGSAYAQAMTRWPDAREAEFTALFEASPVLPGQGVLDVPAGGGYLRARLAQARVEELEFSEGFSKVLPVVPPLGPWPAAQSGPFDHIVCLAALHHIQEGDAFIRRLVGLLAPGGVLHLADVPAGSGVAGFLDGFVGRFNQTGHSGLYRTADRGSWARLGSVLRCEERVVPWRFAHDDDMLAFTAGLFGVSGCPMPQLMQALEQQVGVSRDAQGVSLLWKLWYVDLAVQG